MKRYNVRNRYECCLNLNNRLGSIHFDVPYSINTPTKFIRWISKEITDDVYRLDIDQYDEIIDIVKSGQKPGVISFCDCIKCKKDLEQKGVIVKNKVEDVSFWISDNVQYVTDIQYMLRSRYGITPQWPKENDKFSPNDVFVISGVQSNFVTGLQTCDKSSGYWLKRFNVTRLDPTKDILLNRKLLQIWPNNTGKMPEQLVNLFKSYNQNVI